MKTQLVALLLGSSVALGLGAVSVAADTVGASYSGSVSGDTSGSACASQSVTVQVNGSSVIDRTDSACTP